MKRLHGKKIVIIGSGGHAKVCADVIMANHDEIVGFFDEINPEGEFIGFPKLGDIENYRNYVNCEFLIAIGDAKTRERIARKLADVQWHTAIHPSAVVSNREVVIGVGTVIMPNAVVNAGTHIGNHCIINSGGIVEHDNVIGDFVHISVGAKTGGNVNIGKGTWIGIGSTIKDRISISSDIVIGAGSVVVKDIDEEGTYVGVPAEHVNRV